MSTELTNLDIDEVSGVDAPANGLPGWMVMKSENATQAVEAQLATLYASIGGASALEGAPEEVRKAAAALSDYVEKQLTAPEPEPSLIEKMVSIFKARPVPPQQDAKGKGTADDNDADDDEPAPAKGKMEKTAAKVAEPDSTDDTTNTQEAQDVAKSLGDFSERLERVEKQLSDDNNAMREALVKALERVEALENELTGSAQVFGQEYDAVEKSAGPSLRDGIMSAFGGNRVTLS